MSTVPDYLNNQTEEAILARMLENIPDELDKNEGSYIWDSLSPVAIELMQANIWAKEVLRRGFAATTYGDYLDLRCQEHGLTRLPAVKATGSAKFYGLNGTTIAIGTRIATLADNTNPSREFQTTTSGTIDSLGIVEVKIEAVEPGTASNVSAGTITILQETITGVTGVINEKPTTAGLDTENDESLLARYLQKVRNPSSGGNISDYINWAMEVSGVGGVSVIPVRDGAGTVSIAIVNSEKEAANQELVDAVQDHIAKNYNHQVEAETLTISGNGVILDFLADNVTAVKMLYAPAGTGSLVHSGLNELLEKPGIWQIRARTMVNDSSSSLPLMQLGIWNVTENTWAKTTPTGTLEALKTLSANQLTTTFLNIIQDFSWNGTDELELRITRLQNDPSTNLWLDNLNYRSAFSTDSGENKAPIGARVTVEPAKEIQVDISCHLFVTSGYDEGSVKNAVKDSIKKYIRSLAFNKDNDVLIVRVGQEILNTPGVKYYENLQINGGSANIDIGVQEVAVFGEVTFL